MEVGGGWIIDLDISKFFDTMSHAHLREILKRRVCDGVLRRLVGKWLKAGVWEEGSVRYPEQGTPQGGVISPMLSNIYLHDVLDKWFMEVVRPRLRGKAYLVRFADDVVFIFSDEQDEGQWFEGEVRADASGVFTFVQPGGFTGPVVNATVTDETERTTLTAARRNLPMSGQEVVHISGRAIERFGFKNIALRPFKIFNLCG